MKSGTRGLTSPLTFVASVNAMAYCDAATRLADIDPDGLGLAPDAVREALAGDDVEIVMPVHFGGLAHAAAELRALADASIVIEDACHALGGTYPNGRPIGNGAYADMAVFSFHPVKPITTAEGGAVVTNDRELNRVLRLLRNHGLEKSPDRLVTSERATDPWYCEQQVLGFNYWMSDLQAALGLSQLDKLDSFRARRLEIALHYDAAFVGLPHVALTQAQPMQRTCSAHHLYVLRIDFHALNTTRKRFMARLAEHSVGSQVHYIPVHHHPYHRHRASFGADGLPMVEHYYRECLSLPLHAGLTDDEVDRVVQAVAAVVGAPC
jgi:dTDP-4-amino-4,6-dideoxygalactose transaminase